MFNILIELNYVGVGKNLFNKYACPIMLIVLSIQLKHLIETLYNLFFIKTFTTSRIIHCSLQSNVIHALPAC